MVWRKWCWFWTHATLRGVVFLVTPRYQTISLTGLWWFVSRCGRRTVFCEEWLQYWTQVTGRHYNHSSPLAGPWNGEEFLIRNGIRNGHPNWSLTSQSQFAVTVIATEERYLTRAGFHMTCKACLSDKSWFSEYSMHYCWILVTFLFSTDCRPIEVSRNVSSVSLLSLHGVR